MSLGEMIETLAAGAPGCRFLIEAAIGEAHDQGVVGATLLVMSQLDELGLYGSDIQALFMDCGEDLRALLRELTNRMNASGVPAVATEDP
jgi:hypothetical protein